MRFLAYAETVRPAFLAAAQRALYSSRVKRSLSTTFRLSSAAIFGLPRFIDLVSYIKLALSSPVLLNKLLNVGQSKAHRAAFGQADTRQFPIAHFAANGDLRDGQQLCYIGD